MTFNFKKNWIWIVVVTLFIILAIIGISCFWPKSPQKNEAVTRHYFTNDGKEIQANNLIPGEQYSEKIMKGTTIIGQFVITCPQSKSTEVSPPAAATPTPDFIDPLDSVVTGLNLSEEQKQALIDIYSGDFTRVKSEIETARTKLKSQSDADIAAIREKLANDIKAIDEDENLSDDQKNLQKSNLNVRANADISNRILKLLNDLEEIASKNSEVISGLKNKFVTSEWFNGCKFTRNADPEIKTIKVTLSRYETNLTNGLKKCFPGCTLSDYTITFSTPYESTATNCKGSTAFDLTLDGVTYNLPEFKEGIKTSVAIIPNKEYGFSLGNPETELLVIKPNSQSAQATSQSYHPKPTSRKIAGIKSGDTISETQVPSNWVVKELNINNTQRKVTIPEAKWNEMNNADCDVTQAILINHNSQLKFVNSGSVVKITDFYFIN